MDTRKPATQPRKVAGLSELDLARPLSSLPPKLQPLKPLGQLKMLPGRKPLAPVQPLHAINFNPKPLPLPSPMRKLIDQRANVGSGETIDAF